jgi:chromosome segregation ATPase
VGLIAAIYVSYRKVELPEEIVGARTDDDSDISQPRQVGAPPALLTEFANLYSRKTALNMDLEKLEAARRRGKVKKREYMIRERDLKEQIEEIDSKLPKVKDEMTRYGPHYRDLVSQLELQDEKIQGAKAGLRQLLLRKKKQRISRVAFEKSRQDYLKTIQKATSATDRILLSIQEEAGEL